MGTGTNNNDLPGGAARPPSPLGGDGEGSPPRCLNPEDIDFFNILWELFYKSLDNRLTMADIIAAHDKSRRGLDWRLPRYG